MELNLKGKTKILKSLAIIKADKTYLIHLTKPTFQACFPPFTTDIYTS